MTPAQIGIVLLGAVAYMVLGMAWYSSRGFGKRWSELSGLAAASREDVERMRKAAMPGYAVSFVGAILMSGMLWTMLGLMGIGNVRGAILLACLLWLGFVATVTSANAMFRKEPLQLWLINAGYNLAGMVVMALILVLWG